MVTTSLMIAPTRFVLYLLLTASALVLSGCASKTQKKVTNAATAPLSDLNLWGDDIPIVLQQARKHPYRPPTDTSCAALDAEITLLNEALGPDVDKNKDKVDPSLLEQGSDIAEDSAIGALQRTTEGIIPFRSWVRKLTGAERRSKEVAASIRAGAVRRAFLKGIGAPQACVWTPFEPTEPKVASSAASSPASAP